MSAKYQIIKLFNIRRSLVLVTVIFGFVGRYPTFAMSSSQAAKNRLVYGKDDALFGSIEEQQGERPFGKEFTIDDDSAITSIVETVNVVLAMLNSRIFPQ